MKDLYLMLCISRQAHFKAVKLETSIRQKEPFYLGLMYDIRDMHPGMGLRKMYEQFEPEGIGRDAWINLGLREGFRLHPTKSPQKTTYAVKSMKYSNLLENREFTDVNQVWVSDIFYFAVGTKNYYGILIMDVYSRKIIGYSIADNMRAENNVKALTMAIEHRGIADYCGNLIHHSDRGSQYMSDIYTEILGDYNIQISVCFDVLENAHCERVNGTIKNEYLNKWTINTFNQLQIYMEKAVNGYNNRKHNSIGMSPVQYETALTEIPIEKRKKMSIFTINKRETNPYQLELDFGV